MILLQPEPFYFKTDPKFRVYPDVFEFTNQHKKNEQRKKNLKEIFPDGPGSMIFDNHQVLDDRGKLIGYKNLRAINTTLSDILLRRTKREIKDQLPGRMDKNFFVEMTKEQCPIIMIIMMLLPALLISG